MPANGRRLNATFPNGHETSFVKAGDVIMLEVVVSTAAAAMAFCGAVVMVVVSIGEESAMVDSTFDKKSRRLSFE